MIPTNRRSKLGLNKILEKVFMYLSANKVLKFVFAVAEFKDFGQSLKYSQKTFLTLSFVRSGTNMKEYLNRKLFLYFHQTSMDEKYQRSLKLKKIIIFFTILPGMTSGGTTKLIQETTTNKPEVKMHNDFFRFE